jgi:hypothetical protein
VWKAVDDISSPNMGKGQGVAMNLSISLLAVAADFSLSLAMVEEFLGGGRGGLVIARGTEGWGLGKTKRVKLST